MAQEQHLRTNSIKNRIDNQNVSILCKVCGEKTGSMTHIISLCPNLAKKHKNYDKFRFNGSNVGNITYIAMISGQSTQQS